MRVLARAGVRVEFIFFPVAGMGLFWTCAEHRADNIEISLLLLSRACTDLRPFLLSMLPWLARNLGVHGVLGGDTAGTGDPS